MEDASAVGPVPVQAHSLQEPVTLLKQEVVINQLLLLCLSQVVEGVVSTSQVPSQAVQSSRHCLLNL